MRKLFTVLFALVLTATLFAAGESEAATAEPVVFRIANGAEPPSLDPAIATDTTSSNIIMGLFDGLLINDPVTADGAPGVAESYTVSDDGLVWTFKLRKSTWSDGVPITAQTVVDSWLHILDPATGSKYAHLPGMVIAGATPYNEGKAGPESVQIRAVDDYTFEATMTGPHPYVTSMLPHNTFSILPMHVIKEHGEKWTQPENMVSNGAFTLAEWKPQEYVRVVKNPLYWDAANVKLDEIIYYASDDNNTRLNMYLAGEVDWMNGAIPLDQMDAMILRDDFHASPRFGTYYYSLNNKVAPFDNPLVRKAMNAAIDKETLVERVTRAGEVAAYQMVPPGMEGYTPAVGQRFDVKAAQKFLADAGYPNGAGFPEVILLYNTSESHKKVAEYAQQQWEENLNITVKIENNEWATHLSRGQEHDFQMLRIGWIGDYLDPNTFLELFVSDSGNNYGQYDNPEFDRLVYQATTMVAGPERYEVLRKAETLYITQDQAVIPVYHYVNKDMIDFDVWGGWTGNFTGRHEPKFIYKK